MNTSKQTAPKKPIASKKLDAKKVTSSKPAKSQPVKVEVEIEKTKSEISEVAFTVKDLAKAVGLTPYKARKILRAINKTAQLGHHVKARWEWETQDEFDVALKAVRKASGK